MNQIVDKNYYIVYASDDNFAEIMGVSIVSLLENNKDAESIEVYILDTGISDKNREKVESIFLKYERDLPKWIKGINIEEKLNMMVKLDRGSFSQYARLFVSTSLPAHLKRVLYIDCDTIVNSSLEEMWNCDMHGQIIAALGDAFSKWYRKNVNLNYDDVMFNSGVMLIDLFKWRKNKIEDKLLEFIVQHDGIIQQGDQGALNAVLSHDTYCFHPKYNAVTIFYDFTYKEMVAYRKPQNFYTEDKIKEALANPTIIHFTTSFISTRPWVKNCQHKYTGLWLEYRAKSPWGNEPLRDDTSSARAKIMRKVYNFLPRRLAIFISSIFQVYIRPLRYRSKK